MESDDAMEFNRTPPPAAFVAASNKEGLYRNDES